MTIIIIWFFKAYLSIYLNDEYWDPHNFFFVWLEDTYIFSQWGSTMGSRFDNLRCVYTTTIKIQKGLELHFEVSLMSFCGSLLVELKILLVITIFSVIWLNLIHSNLLGTKIDMCYSFIVFLDPTISWRMDLGMATWQVLMLLCL